MNKNIKRYIKVIFIIDGTHILTFFIYVDSIIIDKIEKLIEFYRVPQLLMIGLVQDKTHNIVFVVNTEGQKPGRYFIIFLRLFYWKNKRHI